MHIFGTFMKSLRVILKGPKSRRLQTPGLEKINKHEFMCFEGFQQTKRHVFLKLET